MSRLLILAAGLVLAAGVARAQGTSEQREACAPDAIRLCPDTIPDVARTRACMRRHEADLSPRCHALFAQSDTDRPDRHARIDREDPYDAPDDGYERPPARVPLPRDAEPDYAASDETERARAAVAHVCEDDIIDARTCAVIDRALRMQESGR